MSGGVHVHRLAERHRVDRIAVLDLESGGMDGTTDPLVAVGAGRYDLRTGAFESEVFSLGPGLDQVRLVNRAYGWLDEFDYEAVVTFNGEFFDFPFIADTLAAAGVDEPEPPLRDVPHVDLAVPRYETADETGRKYPTLEECLAANDIPVHTTHWDGAELTNTRFGEELAPRYVDALRTGDAATVESLHPTVYGYTVADIEATAALYCADTGRDYAPRYPE